MQLAFCLFRYFPFSGLARDMLRIADAAHDRGHQVHILTAAWQGASSGPHGVEIIPVSAFSNHGRVMHYSRGIEEKVHSSNFDKVVGFNKTPGLDIYYAADACFVARARYARHSFYRLTPRYKSYHRLEQAVFKQDSPTHNLVLSERAKDEYQEFYGTEDSRFTVLPPNLSTGYQNVSFDKNVRQRVRNELGIEEHELILLMVGSGFKTKGVDRAILALAVLPPELRRITRLVVVGAGKAQPFVNLARDNEVEKQVLFLGGRDDVPDLMRAATLFIHPAYNENTGTVLIEAMAMGLPVVTTDVCGYAHHVKAADAGWVLDSPFSQTELNKAVHKALLSNANEWSNNGRRYVQQSSFCNMPQTVVDSIEQTDIKRHRSSRKGKDFLYLSNRLNFDQDTYFDKIMDLPGEVYRQVPGRRTLRFIQDGNGYFLKTHQGVGWHEIIKNLLYLKRPVLGADSEWHALHFLNRIGLKVPKPLGFGQKGRNPAKRLSFVIMEEIRDAISLEDFAKQKHGRIDNIRLKRALIFSLANIARTLHMNGANHRDFYLCHFLVSKSFTSKDSKVAVKHIPLMLIDLHRAQIRRKTPQRWIIKDLGALYYSAMHTNVTRHDLLRFIKIYCASPLRSALSGPVNWDKVQWRAYVLHQSDKSAQV